MLKSFSSDFKFEMMLITNLERILIIKTEIVNAEAQRRQNVESWFKSDIWDVRQREEECDTEEIQTSRLILNMQGMEGPLFIEKWKLNGNVMMMRMSDIALRS